MNPTQLANDNPAYPVKVYSAGVLVDEGTVLEGTVLASGGEADLMVVSSGGSAIETDLGTGGLMTVEAGGTIIGINVNGGTYSGAGYCSGANKWYGPAICNTMGTIQLSGGTFLANDANNVEFGGGNGGAVETWCGNDEIADCYFSGNSAGTGGGAYLMISGNATLTNNTFLANSAIYGGAVQNYGGPMIVSGGVMNNNSATAGGAFENHAGGSALLAGVTFAGNSGTSGGAVFNDNFSGAISELTASDCLFSGNSGAYGAAFLNTGIAQIRGGAIVENSGEYGVVENYTDGKLTVAGVTFSANAGTYGGAFANQAGPGGSALVSGATFTSNTAAYAGAGVCNIWGTMTIAETAFTDNTAANDGAGIANWGDATIENVRFEHNVATSGGAVSHLWAGTLAITGATFIDNVGYDRGGALASENSGAVSIARCIFHGNTAAAGGAIYNAGSITITDTSFQTTLDTVVTLGATTLAGVVSFAGDVTVGAAVTNTGTLVFDLVPRAISDAALISDLSKVSGGSYTVAVSSTQNSGIYRLAEGASAFASDIALTIDGKAAGTFTAASGAITFGDITYTCAQSEGLLTLSIDRPVSTVAEVILTITDPNHEFVGATGGWKVQPDQTVAWQDISTLGAGYSYLGLGSAAAGKAMPDIYVYNADAKFIGAYVTDDTGAVASFESIFTGDGALMQVGLGDFNADGISDLLLRTADGFVGYYANGAFAEVQGLGLEWTVAAIGDVDGNGCDDVIIAHEQGYVGAYLIGNDGSISWADLGNLDSSTAIVGAGDVNGDGTDDVIIQVGANYYGAWLCGQGAVTGFFGIGEFDASVQDIADYNADGKDDLLFRTASGVVGAALITDADTTTWAEYGALGSEWSTKGVGIL